MLLNSILLFIIVVIIVSLIKYLRRTERELNYFMPICRFNISKPEFDINQNTRTVKFKVYTKNENRYFRDFPLEFKFYSDSAFRSKIKIEYSSSEDDETELIYDRIVEFENNKKQHIYYINDVIIGSIDIEIETYSFYGKPTILFEILQSNMCHMNRPHSLEIVFPE